MGKSTQNVQLGVLNVAPMRMRQMMKKRFYPIPILLAMITSWFILDTMHEAFLDLERQDQFQEITEIMENIEQNQDIEEIPISDVKSLIYKKVLKFLAN